MYITTFNFVFTSTNKPVGNVLIIVDVLENVLDGKLSVQNDYLSAPLRHKEVNCSSAWTEVLTGEPLLQLENTLLETEHLCIIDMHSDTELKNIIILKCFVTSFWSIMAAILILSAIIDPNCGFITYHVSLFYNSLCKSIEIRGGGGVGGHGNNLCKISSTFQNSLNIQLWLYYSLCFESICKWPPFWILEVFWILYQLL